MKKIIPLFFGAILISAALKAQYVTTGSNPSGNAKVSGKLEVQNDLTVGAIGSTHFQSADKLKLLNGDLRVKSTDGNDADIVVENNQGKSVSLWMNDNSNEGFVNTTQEGLMLSLGGGNWRSDMHLTSNGNIGIGTTSPSSRLEVLGSNANFEVSNTQEAEAGILLNDAQDQGNQFAKIYYHSGTNKLNFYVSGWNQGNSSGQDVKMTIENSGKVGIGTTTLQNAPDQDFLLWVKKGIRTEAVVVDVAASNGWADYVFDEDYNLEDLSDVEEFISNNHHLPHVPSEEEVNNGGINLAAMDATLLRKIEELTLYVIAQDKKIAELQKNQQASPNNE